MRLVKRGIKSHWWQPIDTELGLDGGNGRPKGPTPLSGPRTADTGEGTRYGRRPKRPNKKHLGPSRKPQQ